MGVFRIRLGAVGYGCRTEMMVGSVTKSIDTINGENKIVEFAPQGGLMAA